jgi:hypothetical protein
MKATSKAGAKRKARPVIEDDDNSADDGASESESDDDDEEAAPANKKPAITPASKKPAAGSGSQPSKKPTPVKSKDVSNRPAVAVAAAAATVKGRDAVRTKVVSSFLEAMQMAEREATAEGETSFFAGESGVGVGSDLHKLSEDIETALHRVAPPKAGPARYCHCSPRHSMPLNT